MEKNLYEAMFLVDSAKGGGEFAGLIRHIVGLLAANGASIERIEKWAERKFEYRVRHVDRGIYILIYFRSAPGSIQELRRQIYLSEQLLRVFILKAEEPAAARGELYDTEGSPVPEEPSPAPAEQPSEAPEAAVAQEPVSEEVGEPEEEAATEGQDG